MIEKKIALVKGDGSAPEMMVPSSAVAIKAARMDGIEIVFEETPMGWNAYEEYGDTLPQKSLDRVKELGIVFFGGVGDPKFDNTIGVKRPEMKPEKRVLLALREKMNLLVNFRPVIFYKELAHLSKVKIPAQDMTQLWYRFLLQDVYFGNDDLIHFVPEEVRVNVGLKLKQDVTGNEEIVSNIAYFTRDQLVKYFRVVFSRAEETRLPLVVIDKSNVTALDTYWRLLAEEISKEFPNVSVSFQYVDAAAMLIVTNPEIFNAVIASQNLQGDILTDLANALVSIGLMHSSAVNPDNGAAMFESGAGTAPTLTGKDVANPLGRILAGAEMLEHIGAPNGANAIREAVKQILTEGYRTEDLFQKGVDDPNKLLGTSAMGELILSYL